MYEKKMRNKAKRKGKSKRMRDRDRHPARAPEGASMPAELASLIPSEAPNLYDGISKCLDDGHKSFASFPVVGAEGVSKLHACAQCGLMFWEK